MNPTQPSEAAAADSGRRRRLVVTAAVLVLLAAGTGAVIWFVVARGGDEKSDTPVFIVKRGPLTISVAERGTIKNREKVVVKSRAEGRSTIIWLIEEGNHVKKGDLLITFDDSSLRNDLERLRIEVATAIARATAAKTGLQRAEAESKKVDIAELALKVAGLRCHSHSAELEMELKMVEREVRVAEKSLELLKRRIEDVVANADGDSLEAAIAEFELFKA